MEENIPLRVLESVRHIKKYLSDYEKIDLNGRAEELILEVASSLIEERAKVIIKERVAHLTMKELSELQKVLNGRTSKIQKK